MNLAQVAAVAVDAQATVHHLNAAARAVGLTAFGEAMRETHRTRLAICAEHFAATEAANEVEFHTEPEIA